MENSTKRSSLCIDPSILPTWKIFTLVYGLLQKLGCRFITSQRESYEMGRRSSFTKRMISERCTLELDH